MPVPLRAMVTFAALEALLERVTDPVAEPAAEGSNCSCRVADWLGFRVTGKLMPGPLKPVPATEAPLMVSGAVPDEVRTTDWVAAVFTATSPNATLVDCRLRAGVPALALSWIAKVVEAPPAVAVSRTVCVPEKADILAVNPALVLPRPTVTEDGTRTRLLLLLSVTGNPPEPAAADRATVQASLPAALIDPLLQESALTVAAPPCPEPRPP